MLVEPGTKEDRSRSVRRQNLLDRLAKDLREDLIHLKLKLKLQSWWCQRRSLMVLLPLIRTRLNWCANSIGASACPQFYVSRAEVRRHRLNPKAVVVTPLGAGDPPDVSVIFSHETESLEKHQTFQTIDAFGQHRTKKSARPSTRAPNYRCPALFANHEFALICCTA